MSDQQRTVEDVLMERLATIQKISSATAEHLRLMQERAGMEVLDMSDAETPEVLDDMGRNEAALETCEERIGALENCLARLDQELEARIEGGET